MELLCRLSTGVDVYLKDSRDRTVLEVLSDETSPKAMNIGTAILGIYTIFRILNDCIHVLDVLHVLQSWRWA